MEGARVENCIFKAKGAPNDGDFFRVVLLWHPADSRKVLPEHFYASHKQWEITLNKASTYDFVRQYCLLGSPTFVVDVGAGKKTKLQR